MIIFIDGYNALRFLFPQNRHSTEAQRAHFLQQLSVYLQTKEHNRVEVRVVFDGGMMDRRHREVQGGVIIMEAGYGRDADSYIVECVDRHDAEVLVVTNDRELQRLCQEEGAEVMKVVDFWAVVREVTAQESLSQLTQGQGNDTFTKMADDNDYDLDMLMIEASLGALPEKEENDDEEPDSSGGAKRSKKEKQAARLDKKLR